MVLRDKMRSLLPGRLRHCVFNSQKTPELLLSCKATWKPKKNYYYLNRSEAIYLTPSTCSQKISDNLEQYHTYYCTRLLA